MLRKLMVVAVAMSSLFVPLQAARAACDVTPFIGASVPTESMILQATGGTLIRNTTHAVYGLSIGTSFSNKFGAELVLGAGSGALEVIGGVDALKLSSTLLFADVRGKFRIMGNDQAGLGLVGGVGYTTQKIGLFDFAALTDAGEFEGKLTGILGLSFDAEVSDRFGLSVEMVDRIREQGIVIEGSTGLNEPTQHDVMITAGLSFGLNK